MCARGQEAQLLAELARSKGETYDATPDFPHLTTKNGFEFSTAEINRLIDRIQRLTEARKNANSRKATPAQAAIIPIPNKITPTHAAS